MFKTFIAGLTAVSLTFAPVPALANTTQNEDFAKLLFGLITLGAVAKMADDRGDRRADAVETPAEPVHDTPRREPFVRYHGDGYGEAARREVPRNRGGFVPPRNPRLEGRFGTVDARVLPYRCFIRANTPHGRQTFYAQVCMERNYAFVEDLPRACRVRLVTNAGPRRGYDPFCLHDRGYFRGPRL